MSEALPLSFAEVEEHFARRIASIDASAHAQGNAPARWHESESPLSVLSDPSSRAHLAFSVWVDRARNTDLESDSEVDGYVFIEAAVRVAFTYRLRPKQQTKDARMATKAAHDIIRAVMAPWGEADGVAGSALVRLVDGLQPALSLDGEYSLISQDYTAAFDLDIGSNRSTAS